MYTVVYPVQDLLVEPPPFIEPPQFDLSYASSRGSAGGGRGGGGGGGGGGGRGGGVVVAEVAAARAALWTERQL